MSSTSWMITSTKRKKSDNGLSAPRKRSRLSNSRTKSQKTLTQAQWITTLPSNHLADDEMLLLPEDTGGPRTVSRMNGETRRTRTTPGTNEETRRPRTAPRTYGGRQLKKRDSTLTQMDFFDPLPLDEVDIDDHLLPATNSPGRDDMPPPQIDGADRDDAPLPQFDGSYSSPRRPRKRKTSIDVKQSAPSLKIDRESREYKPSGRKRTTQKMERKALPNGRRTSHRLASKQVVFTDPTQSFEYFNEVLTRPSRDVEQEMNESLESQLEIKDSVPEEEAEAQADFLSPKLPLQPPRTPTQRHVIILSSQSPESLPPSTRKCIRLKSPSFNSESRKPLAERSINALQRTPTKRSSKKQRNRKGSQPSSPARKVVVLKLPKRRQVQQVPRIEDSQKNIWSIPSSSPYRQRDMSVMSVRQPAPTIEDDLEGAEIPASSQVYSNVVSRHLPISAQDSLPDVADLVKRHPGLKKNDADIVENDVRSQQPPGKRTTLHESATSSKETGSAGSADGLSDSLLLHSESLLNSAPTRRATLLIEDSEEDELISPVKLSPSTPGQRQQGGSGGESLKASPIPTAPTVNDRSTPKRSPINPTDETRTPLPLPQLVSQTTTQRRQTQASLVHDQDEFQLPGPPLIQRTSTHVSTTQIPLNDIETAVSSSSVPSNNTTTQKSVNPASMPHPSQMSTQDATQGLFPMSSFPPPLHDKDEDEIRDKITIKDSSSYHVSMSQLPQHMNMTQSQPTVDLGLDEVFGTDGEEDLDLDPPSTASLDDHHMPSDIQIERTPPTTRTVDALHQEGGGVTKGKHVDKNQGSPKPIRQALDQTDHESQIPSSQQSVSTIPSSPNRPPVPPLLKKYGPLPGFNNDTQSNFTQNGHVTAAYVHRQWEDGVLPKWYTPQPFQIPGYTRRR